MGAINGFLFHLATFFGVGRLPKAPGTWGTLATIPLSALLLWLGPLWQMIFIALFLPLSIWSAQVYFEKTGVEDPSEVVVDEVIGFLITMVWLPMTWQSFVASFLLFRLLDVAKPFPIGYLDRKGKGGVGIVIDDVAAGIIANILLQLAVTHTNWLGVQSVVITQPQSFFGN